MTRRVPLRIALLHDRFSGPEVFRGFLVGATVGPREMSPYSPDLGRAVGFDFESWTQDAVRALQSGPAPDCIVAVGAAVAPAVLFARSNPVPILAIEPDTQRAIPPAVLNAHCVEQTPNESVDAAADVIASTFARAANGEALPTGPDRTAAIEAMVEVSTLGLTDSGRDFVRTSLDDRFDELYELATRTDWTRTPTESDPWENQIAKLESNFSCLRRPTENPEFDRWRDAPIVRSAHGTVIESRYRSQFPWIEDPAAVRTLIDTLAAST